MNIPKAVVTAAAQRTLALQTVIDRDGHEKSVLRIIVEEIRRAKVDEIAVVIAPGDEAAYARAVGDRTVRFIEQVEPSGYAQALYAARGFVRSEAFLHLVGDHLYIDGDGGSCARGCSRGGGLLGFSRASHARDAIAELRSDWRTAPTGQTEFVPD
jgi:UTP--glucose-1-phosphate uridylyltransferase